MSGIITLQPRANSPSDRLPFLDSLSELTVGTTTHGEFSVEAGELNCLNQEVVIRANDTYLLTIENFYQEGDVSFSWQPKTTDREELFSLMLPFFGTLSEQLPYGAKTALSLSTEPNTSLEYTVSSTKDLDKPQACPIADSYEVLTGINLYADILISGGEIPNLHVAGWSDGSPTIRVRTAHYLGTWLRDFYEATADKPPISLPLFESKR